jgi:hypothetical protein
MIRTDHTMLLSDGDETKTPCPTGWPNRVAWILFPTAYQIKCADIQ